MLSQPSFTCSKLTVETEQVVKYVKKLTTKRPEPHHWRRSGAFIVNFEYTSYIVLVFLLLTLNM